MGDPHTDDDATISYAGAGEGPGSQPDPIEEGSEGRQGPYASEDDEGTPQPPDDDGQGADAPPPGEEEEGEDGEPTAPARPKAPEVAELEARVAEKERQAHSLTRALQIERQQKRLIEDRFYQVIHRAMEHTAGAAAAAGEEPQEPEIDPHDPVAKLQHGVDSLHERLDQQEQAQAEQSDQQLVDDSLNWVRADAEAFIASEPSYPEAAAFVAEKAKRQILAGLYLRNPGADPDELAALAEQEFLQDTAMIQVRCIQGGVSYAAAVMKAARDLDWKPRGSAPAGRARPAAPAGRRSSMDAELSSRRSAPSLSHVAGAPPRRQPTTTDVLNMDDNQFDAWMESGDLDFKALAEQIAGGSRN